MASAAGPGYTYLPPVDSLILRLYQAAPETIIGPVERNTIDFDGLAEREDGLLYELALRPLSPFVSPVTMEALSGATFEAVRTDDGSDVWFPLYPGAAAEASRVDSYGPSTRCC